MILSDRHLLDFLSRMPFVDSAELADILGEAHATVHRALTSLLADGIVGRVSHGTCGFESQYSSTIWVIQASGAKTLAISAIHPLSRCMAAFVTSKRSSPG